tara:strand:- start:1131 stop:1934 length:804 start_codon:yes stop_codon:yes gene_type:complete
MSNPYDVLGVNSGSSDEEIKSAYRRLAKQHHPDAGGDQKHFAEISNAYESIKDADARFQHESHQQQGPGPGNFTSGFNQHFGDFNDIFNQMFGQHGSRGPMGGYNRDADVTVHVELKDIFDSVTKKINITMPNGMSKPVSINIPRGINHGSRVKYDGMSPMGGDLYVRFMIKKTTGYTVDNDNNIHKKETITLRQAMFGGEMVVNTLDDRSIKVTIHPGTQSGTKLRIPESGLPKRNQPNGDLIIEVKVIIPKLSIPDLYKPVQDVL